MDNVVSFQSECNKRNIDIALPPAIEQDNLTFNEHPDNPTAYEGDFVHEEDRVRITLDPAEDRVFLEIYDNKINEKYVEFDFDCYTLYLLSNAFICMYESLEGEYSI